MTFEIRDHRIVGARYVASPNHGGTMKPAGGIFHWTAGATAQSAVGFFQQRSARASAHFVIHADGDITQMVPLNVQAWHAGNSVLNGRDRCNHWTHGWEIVNPGFYTIKNGEYWDWSGKRRVSDDELAMWPPDHHQKLARLGGGTYAFPAFKEAQIETCLELLAATSAHYGYSLIAGHDEIDKRGWKVDPGPLFPWDRFDALVSGAPQKRGPVDEVPRGNVPTGPDTTRRQDTNGRKMAVDATSLNVRQGPGTSWKVVGSIPKGTAVEVLRDEGDWCRIGFTQDGQAKVGWVAEAFLRGV